MTLACTYHTACCQAQHHSRHASTSSHLQQPLKPSAHTSPRPPRLSQVHERTLHQDAHHALVNTIRFLPWLDSMACCTASSDGTVQTLDLDTGQTRTLLDLNPGGWHEGIKDWNMAYGCGVSRGLGLVLAGDSSGRVHLLDPRAGGGAGGACVNVLPLHKKGNKVVSVDVNPMDDRVVLTAGG